MNDPFNRPAAISLAESLERTGDRLVLAESCTAGLVAASLARIPGISQRLTGSAVVYQEVTKTQWLHISPETLQSDGVVSAAVAEQMAHGALNRTPHATLAASVTGHLGPDAPSDLDGVVWSAVAVREDGAIRCTVRQLPVDGNASPDETDIHRRHRRQIEAARQLMLFCQQRVECITDESVPDSLS